MNGNVRYNMAEVKKSIGLKTLGRKRVSLSKIVVYIFLAVTSVISILPLYFMICYSSTSIDVSNDMRALFPGLEFFKNYEIAIKQLPIPLAFRNSLIVSVTATMLSAYFGGLTAFAFAKYKFMGKRILFAFIIATLIIPQQISVIGFFKVCSILDIKDSLLALIIPAIASSGFVFFVRYYIESAVPDSVMDSARIDGLGEFRIFNRIVLPMIVPAMAAMSLLTFTANWNSYIIPLVVLKSERLFTLPIWTLLARGSYAYGRAYVLVVSMFSFAMIFVLYVFFSRLFIKGITMGHVKD